MLPAGNEISERPCNNDIRPVIRRPQPIHSCTARSVMPNCRPSESGAPASHNALQMPRSRRHCAIQHVITFRAGNTCTARNGVRYDHEVKSGSDIRAKRNSGAFWETHDSSDESTGPRSAGALSKPQAVNDRDLATPARTLLARIKVAANKREFPISL